MIATNRHIDMSLIENIIRPEVRALAAYHVPDSTGFVKLDAMENPYILPEQLRTELGQRLADKDCGFHFIRRNT